MLRFCSNETKSLDSKKAITELPLRSTSITMFRDEHTANTSQKTLGKIVAYDGVTTARGEGGGEVCDVRLFQAKRQQRS